MLPEEFITSILAQQRVANTAIAKDIGIHLHTLHPTHSVKSTFKKSSTPQHGLAVSSSHIFAAQQGKAIVHVYSRERGNQEAIISFPERISCISLIQDDVLVVGTVEGRLILWEVCTGRTISTPASHLQAVTSIAASSQYLLSGSEDSNILVWSIPALLTLNPLESFEPIRSLSNHRDGITSLVVGQASDNSNICVSTSKDKTCIVWNYQSGTALRTFLLPTTPLCLTLEPCDRSVYLGFEDGTVQSLDLLAQDSTVNSLHDSKLQSVPVQVSTPSWTTPGSVGGIHCMALSYDGTSLITGHACGKVVQWDTAGNHSNSELVDLNAPVNNLVVLSTFPKTRPVKAVNVVKPKIGDSMYTYTAQFVGDSESSQFQKALQQPGVPSKILQAAIMDFARPATAGPSDEKLKKENEMLWDIVNEQRALQKRTYDKYNEIKTSHT